jgi:hypothetical protein
VGAYNTRFAGIAIAFSLILAGSLAHGCWSQDKPAQGKAHPETRARSNGAASAGSAGFADELEDRERQLPEESVPPILMPGLK